MIPLFVCHANCSRSMLAAYLYRDITRGPALSAGMDAGMLPAERAVEMLAYWGIDASGHRPRQVYRAVCDQAEAIFVMAAPYLRRLLIEYGDDLAGQSYLFADPFTRPVSFAEREYAVIDPSWDHRPASELCGEHAWLRDRVAQIHDALSGQGRPSCRRPTTSTSWRRSIQRVTERLAAGWRSTSTMVPRNVSASGG